MIDLEKMSLEELMELEKKLKEVIKRKKKKLTFKVRKVKDAYYLELCHREGEKVVTQYIGKVGSDKTLKKIKEMEKEKEGLLEEYEKLMKRLIN